MKQELIIKRELSEGWKFVRLGSILEMNYGKGLANAERKKGEIPVYGSNGVIGFNNDCLIDFNTIIIGRKGSAGELNFVERPCWPIDTTYYVGTRYNLKFIYYLLKHINLKKITQKGAKPGLNREEAYDLITIFTEDETEQQKIVSKLDKQMEQIEMMKKEAEKELLVFNNFKQSFLFKLFHYDGNVPKDWKKYIVEEILEPNNKKAITMGPFGSSLKKDELVEKGIQVLWIKNIKENYFINKGKSFITPKKYEQLKVFTVNENDLIMTTMGTIGLVSIVPKGIQKSIISSHLIKIKFNTQLVIPELMAYFLGVHSPAYLSILNRAHGGIMKGLNTTIIKKTKVLLPPITKQKELLKIILSTFKEIDMMQKDIDEKINAINQLPSSILNEVFGQYKIPEEV